MFTFSHRWLESLNKAPIAVPELLEILNLQGLEVKKIAEENDDTIITIEVKANRAFCLSHLGVLREYNAFKKIAAPNYFADLPKLNFKENALPFVLKTSHCTRFAAIKISDLNNQVATPKAISEALTRVGVNTVNAVVDILNYIMLETGQPLHAYDLAKVAGVLTVEQNSKPEKLLTLNQVDVEIPKDSIVIRDDKKILNLAGVIGGNDCAVEASSKTILIECAQFDPVMVRIAARALKISTLSSFRFERGIDAEAIPLVLAKCVQMITGVCGGVVDEHAYEQNRNPKANPPLVITAQEVESVLGIKLTLSEIKKCLEQYYFICELEKERIKVMPPSYRTDINSEIELIGEVARIYGYHNVPALMPRMHISYSANAARETNLKLRQFFTGLNFYEVMNYGFTNADSLQHLNLTEKNPVILQNPLSNDHSLMRPVLAYSLLQNLAYNYSISNKNLGLFEIGNVYSRDDATDTGYREHERVAAVMTGFRIERGFGLVKDVDYNFYDLLNLVDLLLQDFNMAYQLKPAQQPYLVPGSGFAIEVNQKCIGYCGQIQSSVLQKIVNGKLILSDVFYFECDLAEFTLKPKKILAKSVFPAIKREYNFAMAQNQPIGEVMDSIKHADALINEVRLKDVYQGKGVPSGEKAVLVEVKYLSAERTLTAEEINALEKNFLEKLQSKKIQLSTA